MTDLFAREVLVSRRALLAPDPSVEADDAQALVAEATATLELVVENADRGVTVDGWRGPRGLVWHVRGDLDTPRLAVVAPAAHLAATVSHMVDLGLRGVPAADQVRVSTVAVRAQMAGGAAVLDGDITRVWSFAYRSGWHEEAIGIVDQGPDGSLWAVTEGNEEQLVLSGVTPLDVWTRLADMGDRPQANSSGA